MSRSLSSPAPSSLGTIESIGSRGEGVFHYEGRRYFFPKAAPGDHVIQSLEGLALEPRSTLRQDPGCSHFAECGGCDFQHLPYAVQFAWKKSITEHWIQRSPLAPFRNEFEIDEIQAPQPLAYRHRVRVMPSLGRAAYRRPKSHALLPLNECPILQTGFLDKVNAHLKEHSPAEEVSLSFDGKNLVHERGSYQVRGRELFYSAACFTQPNPSVNEQMLERVAADCEKLEAKEKAWDLFCGIGNFSSVLDDYFSEIEGVDSSKESIRFAKINFPRHTWRQELVHSFLKRRMSDSSKPDFVLVDPSRGGDRESCQLLAKLGAPHITYVSCQLDSLIRDLLVLVKSGSYQIARWTLVDLLPQTRHIESIVSLKRRS